MTAQSKPTPDQRATTVYPADGGESVGYPGCEIDEVDDAGALRVAVCGPVPTQDEAPIYVVWAPGTWQRAETVVAPAESVDPPGNPQA